LPDSVPSERVLWPPLLDALAAAMLEQTLPCCWLGLLLMLLAVLGVLGLLLMLARAVCGRPEAAVLEWPDASGVPRPLAAACCWCVLLSSSALMESLKLPGTERCRLRLARLVGLPGKPELVMDWALILHC
jgi:hypothetical protein